MNQAAANCGYRESVTMTFPEVVTPERLYRGSSLRFAWIPAKNMRE